MLIILEINSFSLKAFFQRFYIFDALFDVILENILHVFDFYHKLLKDPNRIEVLGDGNQTKSYMHVSDCIDGILLGIEKASAPVNIFNLGVDGIIKVRESLALIVGQLGLSPEIIYTGGIRGWVGDSPLIHLDCARIRALGWQPRMPIDDGVLCTLAWLKANSWVFEGR